MSPAQARADQGRRIGSQRLAVDFFTHSHRISTQFLVRGRPLIATLNDPTLSYIELDVAYVSRIDNPGDLVADYAISILRKENISFCVVAAQVELALKTVPQAQVLPRRSRHAFCTVPSFEIAGQIDVPGTLDLHQMMAIGSERFMPIHNATATISLLQSVSFRGELILVNKERIQVFCVSELSTKPRESTRS
jgi:hypothetical protein